MGWYKDWFGTRYYALLYGHRDEGDAQAWVDMVLSRWGLPSGGRVLDMACGRGRHAKWFHACGMEVTGIDISEESIDQARARHPGPSFMVHDMRRPFADGYFDAAVCLFNSLGYFEEAEDDKAVLRTAYQALRPGGRFVIDLMNMPRVLSGLVPEEQVEREGVCFRIRRTLEGEVIVKRIEVEDAGKRLLFEERVRVLRPRTMDELVKDAGFRIMDRTDGPVPLPYDPVKSDRYVLWTERPLS